MARKNTAEQWKDNPLMRKLSEVHKRVREKEAELNAYNAISIPQRLEEQHPHISGVTIWRMDRYIENIWQNLTSRKMGRDEYNHYKNSSVGELFDEIRKESVRKYSFSNLQREIAEAA